MDVSIIIPLHKQDNKIMKKIDIILRNQLFKGKKEIIKINKGLGLASSLNYGIRKAKYSVIVSLHQDCIPSSPRWLNNLITPLKDKNVVASVSKVELPFGLWNSFDLIAKILSAKEQRIITPGLDEKGCAYRKSSLLKVGLFNERDFRTAGEDVDMCTKLSKIGEIAYPDALVIHNHFYTWKSRIKKELQLSNGSGAICRIYGKKMGNFLFKSIIKAVPFIGFPFFLLNLDFKKLKELSFLAPFVFLFINIVYSYGFWKGFLMKMQTV